MKNNNIIAKSKNPKFAKFIGRIPQPAPKSFNNEVDMETLIYSAEQHYEELRKWYIKIRNEYINPTGLSQCSPNSLQTRQIDLCPANSPTRPGIPLRLPW